MQANSRWVTSNQEGPHDNLEKLVLKHLNTRSHKPYSQHTLDAFSQAQQWLDGRQGELILDSCCGVGESTAYLAKQYPKANIIGVDKSALRTEKHERGYADGDQNYLVLRADLNDFWRLANEHQWRPVQHFLLYPNPWPKSVHIKRRWHGGAAFPDILALGGLLTVRSNWQLYIDEFDIALRLANKQADKYQYLADEAMTPFERKYWASGQKSWQLVSDLNA